jgi:hypothetical protein
MARLRIDMLPLGDRVAYECDLASYDDQSYDELAAILLSPRRAVKTAAWLAR